MNSVLDASALLAFVLQEPGHPRVMDTILAETCMTTVNFAEVAAVYARIGQSDAQIRHMMARLSFPLIDVDPDLAVRAALMTPAAKPFGLSLGDRICLALAARLGVPAITADKIWAEAGKSLGIRVEMIR
jgi:PIN domain nuclease of toxin-antitoxin system